MKSLSEKRRTSLIISRADSLSSHSELRRIDVLSRSSIFPACRAKFCQFFSISSSGITGRSDSLSEVSPMRVVKSPMRKVTL